MAARRLAALASLAVLATVAVQAGERNHQYKEGDEVTLWVNKVRLQNGIDEGGKEGRKESPRLSASHPPIHPPTHLSLFPPQVGPYHNPHETYEYYDLPFCKPVGGVETRRRSNSLGEQLEGHELMNSGYKLTFAGSVESTKVCSMKLGKADAKKFVEAVDNHYW